MIGSVFLFDQEIGGQDIVSRLKKTMERTLKKEFMEAEAQGEARGKIETRREIAIAMIRKGLENTLIAEVTGLTMEQIDELRQSAAN